MPRILISALFSIIFFSLSARAEWKPAAGPLMTKWAADVKPENPLPDYPRPQMTRDKWLSLNGLWQFQLPKDAKDAEAIPAGQVDGAGARRAVKQRAQRIAVDGVGGREDRVGAHLHLREPGLTLRVAAVDVLHRPGRGQSAGTSAATAAKQTIACGEGGDADEGGREESTGICHAGTLAHAAPNAKRRPRLSLTYTAMGGAVV